MEKTKIKISIFLF